MVLFMLVLSALFMILEWICIGFGIWKVSFYSFTKRKGEAIISLRHAWRWMLRPILSLL